MKTGTPNILLAVDPRLIVSRLALMLLTLCLLCGCHTNTATKPVAAQEQTPLANYVEQNAEPVPHAPVETAIITNATLTITPSMPSTGDDPKHYQNHVVHLGGTSRLLIRHAPNSTAVKIAFARWEENETTAVFRLTNSQACAILMWNIRVEVPSSISTTNPPTWKTLWSDYPAGLSRYPAGAVVEFKVGRPTNVPFWRAAIIYSQEQIGRQPPPGMNKFYSDDYEVISETIKE